MCSLGGGVGGDSHPGTSKHVSRRTFISRTLRATSVSDPLPPPVLFSAASGPCNALRAERRQVARGKPAKPRSSVRFAMHILDLNEKQIGSNPGAGRAETGQ